MIWPNRDRTALVIECDSCDSILFAPTSSIDHASAAASAAGWQMSLTRGTATGARCLGCVSADIEDAYSAKTNREDREEAIAEAKK